MNKLHKQNCTNNTVYGNVDQVWYKRREVGRDLEPGKVVLQYEKVIVERHEMTYVLVKKCCKFNLKNVGGEQVTTFDAEAAKTKAPIKKVNNDVDDDCKETARRDESLAVSKQEETLPEESQQYICC